MSVSKPRTFDRDNRLGPYIDDEESWPVLPIGQFQALHDIGLRRVAVVWHDEEFPRLGRKPWYGLTCGHLPTTLHTLWLHGLIRLDKHTSVLRLDADAELAVGRARLTPLGRRVLEANR